MSTRLFAAILAAACFAPAQSIHMIRSLAGATGHVSGTKFVFDETRNRFVYPQDKSLIVYFVWSAPPGLHTITAVWKTPDGRVASIPSDIKVEIASGDLSAYWTLDISPQDPPGIWTFETRVDGEPGGSQSVEIYTPEVKHAAEPSAPKAPPTVDELYRAAIPSLVTVWSLDASGQKRDSTLGFVYAQDLVLASFEGIDGATSLQLAFSDGSTAVSGELAGYDRNADWALIAVRTGGHKPLPHSDASSVQVGDRVLAFTMENGKNIVAASVDVTGRAHRAIQINPALPPVSAGSPLFDQAGKVAGVLGDWATPGSRIASVVLPVNQAVWPTNGSVGGATPIERVKAAQAPVTLHELTQKGAFTPPVESFPPLVFATTTDLPSKRDDIPDRNVTEFPRSVPALWVVSLWARRDKQKSAIVSLALFDLQNKKLGESPGKKVSFGSGSNKLANSIPLSSLEPGGYRIDVIADGNVVWRRFVTVGN